MKPIAALAAQDAGVRRSTLMRWAMVGSIVSKVTGLGLQAVAVPMVYHSLGQHRFALYLLLTAALATIALAQMGAGPGLTQGVAHANAAGDQDRQSALIAASFRLTFGGALIGGCAVWLLLHTVPVERLFGEAFVSDRAEILQASNICVFVLMLQLMLGVVDSSLAGYQEQVFSTLGQTIANVLTVAALVVLCRGRPSIVQIILTLYCWPAAARAANLWALFNRRPYLLRGMVRSARGAYRGLVNVGLAFWIIQACDLLQQHSGNFILARISSISETDVFGIVYKYAALAVAVVSVVTQPLWPAITDAIAHHDMEWIHRSLRRIRLSLTAYSGLLALGAILAGARLCRWLLHVDTGTDPWLFVALGGYFLATIRTHLSYITLMGLQRNWSVAAVLLFENLLMILFGLLLAPRLGATGMALAYLLASVALPLWLLPRLMARSLNYVADAKNPGTTTGPVPPTSQPS